MALLNQITVAVDGPTLYESFNGGEGSAKRPSDGLEDGRGKRRQANGHSNGHANGQANRYTNGQSSDPARQNNSQADGSGASRSASDSSPPVYINPSPTSTSPFPFVSTTFGSSSSPGVTFNTRPDPPPYTLVTFGAGVKSKELDRATSSSPFGAFYVPTSAFPVGSGQFLSGGFGFIGRKHGLAMDNIVEVEMVLADGRIVWVGEGTHSGDWRDDEKPEEVWWGLRGAGTILGVVTRFRAKAYYLPSVFAGNFIYMFDEDTPSLLRHVRDCVKGSPRTLYTNIIITAGPPGAPAIVVIQLCFSGKRAEGEMYVQAISSWDGRRCLFQDFSERTFERQQVAIEEVLKGGEGRKWYIKSDMLKSLSDKVIDETCKRFSQVPDGCTWLFEYTGGGALSDHESCFPPSHREAAFTVAALHQWGHDEPPVEDTRCVITAEEWISEVIHPNSPGGPLPCFLQSSTEADVAGVFGEFYPRLQRLKRVMDPSNFFRHTLWPPQTSPYEDGNMMFARGAADGVDKQERLVVETAEGKAVRAIQGD